LSHVLRKAFRRSLENKGSILTIIFLNDEKFASSPELDRLPFERYDEKEILKVFIVKNYLLSFFHFSISV
ncbi:MAG: hypothetical protein WCW47_03200, partial [Candidatus Paceibacterota bacterium]